ncbi:MAG: ArsR/SmtB family transcription factor [Planctomycetota bacterium]|jgi:ArsR family transcriptional regulator
MKDLISTFKVLSDENRTRIILMLKIRPLCVCEIYEVLNIALSTISAHLKLMKNAGMIKDAKDGRWVIYDLARSTRFANGLIDSLEMELHDDPVVKNDRAKISKITREICSSKFQSAKNIDTQV